MEWSFELRSMACIVPQYTNLFAPADVTIHYGLLNLCKPLRDPSLDYRLAITNLQLSGI